MSSRQQQRPHLMPTPTPDLQATQRSEVNAADNYPSRHGQGASETRIGRLLPPRHRARRRPRRPPPLHRLRASRSSRSTSREDVADLDLDERLGEPGEYPFTRGIHPEMYRSRRWTMRQYAGYATAQETNIRYRYLLEKGSTGLSMAFDLPTQLGRDSDDPLCLGEVGRTGVAIDSIDDMRTAFDQIPLDQVSTSMTINAPGRDPAPSIRAGRRGAGRAGRAAARHGAERHPQGVRGARELHLPARGRDAPHDRHLRRTATSTCRSGTRSRSPATTCARRAARRCRRSRSRSRTRSPTCRPRSTPASRSTSSRRSSRSSSTGTTTSSRRSPSSAPCGACGRRSCATASAPRTRARR